MNEVCLSFARFEMRCADVRLEQRSERLLQCRSCFAVQVIDGLYKAVGYSFGHTTILEGDTGMVIVDTTESTATASVILEDLRKITDKPITGIIYTHYGSDHIQGTAVLWNHVHTS